MAGWTARRLGDLCDFKYGKMPAKSDLVAEGGFPVFSGYRIVGGASSYHYEHPEIVVVARGVGGTGDVKMSPPKCFLTNLSIAVLPRSDAIDKTFLYYELSSRGLWHLRTGSAQAQITIERLRDEPVQVPSLSEQRRIAEVALAYDDLIENCERRIRVLDEMARALYREWFVLFRYPGHEKIPLVDSPLGPIPKGWRAATIADAAHSVNYGYTTKASPEFEGPRFLRITDIVPALVDWDRVPRCAPAPGLLDRYGLFPGDIVVARSGTVGAAKRIHRLTEPVVFASYLVRIRMNDTIASNLALGILMQSREYRKFVERHAGGVAQPNAAAPVLTSMPLALPPRALSRSFDRLAEPLIEQISLLTAEARNLRRARALLLPRLLSGQLSVEDAA